MRPRALGLLLFCILSGAAAAASPLRITGRLLPPLPAQTQIELFPLVSSHAEAVRQLAGATVPPVASTQPRPDGTFEIQAPESGLYRVRVQAEGRLATEFLLLSLIEDAEIPPVELRPVSPPLEVTVIGPDDRPVPNLRVRALSTEAFQAGTQPVWRPAQSEGTTNADGKVTLPQGGIGELSIVTLVPGVPDRVVAKIEGSHYTLRLTRREPRVLEVRGKDGKPMAGVLARWNFMPFGVTGSDGLLPLPVPASAATLRLETADGPLAELPLTAKAEGRLTVQLPAGRTATGQVRDARTHAPLAGALVWSDWHRPVRTDAQGRFKLPIFADDTWIGAEAAGHLYAAAELSPGEDRPTALALQPAASLAGLVVDGTGRPVAGAAVQAELEPSSFSDDFPTVPAQSGDDGRFRLAGLALGKRYRIFASREGFAPATEVVEAKAQGDSPPLRIVLQRGSILFGRVVDPEGRPVAGAKLSLQPSIRSRQMRSTAWRKLRLETSSDSTGRFRWTGLSAGSFDLGVTYSGFASRAVEEIEIPAEPQSVDLAEITLEPGVALEGRVTDRRGAPIASAEVTLLAQDWNRHRLGLLPDQPVMTGADGRFRFVDLEKSTRCDLSVRSAGFVPAKLPGVEVPTPEPLRVELATSRVLTGRVVGPLGEPVQQAEISQMEHQEIRLGLASSSSTSSESVGRTDENGRFQITEIAAGPVDLTFSAPGYKLRLVRGIDLPEDGGEPLEVVLEKGDSVEGRVTDGQGDPVPGAWVRASRQDMAPFGTRLASGTADGDGRYRLDGLEPGSYEIQAESPDQQTVFASLEVRPGVNHLDLAFPGGVEVDGHVFDRTGAPVPGATVGLRTVPQGQIFHTEASADGSFRITAVADGDYYLAGQADGFAETIQSNQVIHIAGQAVHGLELRLDRGTLLTGRILGITPEQNRPVWIRAMSHPQPGHVIASLPGQPTREGYRIPGLRPGEWTVTLNLQDGRSAQGSIVIEPGTEQAVLDLEVQSGFTLSGRVLLDGAALANATISLQGGRPEEFSGGRTTTAWDGSFHIPGLKAGHHRLVAAGPGGIGENREIEITEDQTVSIEISTGSVSGQVLSAQGAPVADALVSLTAEASSRSVGFGFQGPTVRSNEDGRFDLPRLGAGTYRITVQRDGFAPAESRFTVTPGGSSQVQIVLKELPPG